MNLLRYDRKTGEFTVKVTANESPEEPGVFARPAFSVFEKDAPLPALSANEAAVWNGLGWLVVADHRADKSWFLIADGTIVEFKLGEVPDKSMSQTFPIAVQKQIDETLRKSEIETEAAVRMQAIVPTVKTIEDVELIIELWDSINPASRNPTSKIGRVINIAQTAKTAVQSKIASSSVAWP